MWESSTIWIESRKRWTWSTIIIFNIWFSFQMSLRSRSPVHEQIFIFRNSNGNSYFIFFHVCIAFCSIYPLLYPSRCVIVHHINVKFCVSKRNFMVCQFELNKFIHVNFRLKSAQWICERSHMKMWEFSCHKSEGLLRIEKSRREA